MPYFVPAHIQSFLARKSALLAAVTAIAVSGQAGAEPFGQPTLNFRGMPGIVDMPAAHHFEDGHGVISYGQTFDGIQRSTFHFQILPRLTVSYRFSEIFGAGAETQDRSFDLRFLLLQEKTYSPALTLGLQDILGTGVMSGEYLVASKTFGALRATAGLGWGRFGSSGGFTNPLAAIDERFKERPNALTGLGGYLEGARFFRGDAAIFGGLQYQLGDAFVLSAEYSSDAYQRETADFGFERKSNYNLAATYRFKNGIDASVAWLYGTTFGAQLSYHFNPDAVRAPRRGFDTPVMETLSALALGVEGDPDTPVRLQGTRTETPQAAPRWTYGLDLYSGPTDSDPDNFLAEGGLRFTSRFALSDAVSLNTEMRQPLFVRRVEAVPDPADRASPNYPAIRTDAALYEDDTNFELRRLTADVRAQFAQGLYVGLSAGVLEQMYSGTTAEMLWWPSQGRIAFGADLALVKKRSPNRLFELEDMQRTSGLVSAYYTFGRGFTGHLRVGKYLAGDTGMTLSLDREFANGFRIGGYATVTDMPDADYGEGSFDKGIRFSIPASWLFGRKSTKTFTSTWRPNAGDGGQQVKDALDLYEEVRRARGS